MQSLSCQTCGAQLHWDGASRTVTCRYCGTEYLIHPRSSDERNADGIGRDEVATIPIPTGTHAGRSYARSFIPRGWTASAADPELTFSVNTPLTMRVRYRADDGSATIARTGCACFEHMDDTQQNAAQQWQISPSDAKRYASYRDAPALCDMTVATPGATCQLLAHETDEDDRIKECVERMGAKLAGTPISDWGYSYCRRTYRLTLPDGTQRLRAVEVLVDHVVFPPSQAEMQTYQQMQALLVRSNPFGLLGGLLARGAQGNVGAPQPRCAWEIVFLVDVDARQESFEDACRLRDLIRASYEETPEFSRANAQLKDFLMQAVAQSQMQQSQIMSSAMSQMAQDNAAHWDRMNAITRDANEHATNVMHDMMASSSAVNDQMANLRSETIREVNTFHANGGVVEASTSWDHVYQSTEDPDRFVATEGFELRPGIDFEELKRTNGDY